MKDEWKSLILDHYKNPRQFGEPLRFDYASEQHNRTCGDNVKIFATVKDLSDEKSRWSFIGGGCSLCLASASLMMELLQNKDRAEIAAVQKEFLELWDKGAGENALPVWQALDGLRAYPVRSRCVKLAWQGLDAIMMEWPSA